MRRRNLLMFLGGAMALGLAGCSASATTEPSDPFINKPAQETMGFDVDGRPMKLSAYQGKVVVLSFWGSWCPPCMSLVPHERELVSRYRDQPFALVGVNSDDESQARLTIDKEKMGWPMFWDGGDSSGPIARAWQVKAWPTMYVIDPKGIVRHKIVGAMPEMLDKAIAIEMAKVGK